jgi:lactoylglutathione lyase
MHLQILPLLSLLLPSVLCCDPSNLARRADNSSTPNPFTIGTDGHAPEFTKGFYINHISLLVSNLTTSKQWYSEVLGMRHIFTFQLSEDLSICYMGHAQGGRNGTGFQTGAELLRDKNNLGGLLELQENKVRIGHAAWKSQEATDTIQLTTDRHFNPTPQNTVSHMGLIVPDIDAAQWHFDSLNVTIIKRAHVLNATPSPQNDIFASAWGYGDLNDPEVQEQLQAILPSAELIGFKEFIVIADPDGNLFEVQGLVPTGI